MPQPSWALHLSSGKSPGGRRPGAQFSLSERLESGPVPDFGGVWHPHQGPLLSPSRSGPLGPCPTGGGSGQWLPNLPCPGPAALSQSPGGPGVAGGGQARSLPERHLPPSESAASSGSRATPTAFSASLGPSQSAKPVAGPAGASQLIVPSWLFCSPQARSLRTTWPLSKSWRLHLQTLPRTGHGHPTSCPPAWAQPPPSLASTNAVAIPWVTRLCRHAPQPFHVWLPSHVRSLLCSDPS